MYKKLENKIAEILKLSKFNRGDKVWFRKDLILEIAIYDYIESYCECKDTPHDTGWYKNDELELYHRNITLSMILEAMNEKISSGKLGQKEMYLEEDTNELCIIFQDRHPIYWQLRKDGKDIPLFEQSEETIKFIYEVLK